MAALDEFQQTFEESTEQLSQAVSERGGLSQSIDQLNQTYSELGADQEVQRELSVQILETLERTVDAAQTAPQQFEDVFEGTAGALLTPEFISAIGEAEDLDTLSSIVQESVTFIEQANVAQSKVVEGVIEEEEFLNEISSIREEILEKIREEGSIQGENLEQFDEKLAVAADTAKALGDGFSMSLDNVVDKFSEIENGFNQSLAEPAQSALVTIQEIGGALVEIATNPLVLAAVAAGALFTEFSNVLGAGQNILDNTGLTADTVQNNLLPAVQANREALARSGVSLGEGAEAAAQLVNEFGTLNAVENQFVDGLEGAVALTGNLAGRLNVSSDEAAGLTASLQDVANATGGTAENLARSTAALASARGVGAQQVFSDIAENSEDIATFSNATDEEIAAAAVGARELGTSLGTILESQKSFLNDLPGQLSAVSEASAFTGVQFDATGLAQSAAEGTEEFQAKLRDELSGIELDNLLPFQKTSIADAFGVSVTELERINTQADALSGTTEDLTDAFQSGDLNLEDAFAVQARPLQRLQNQFSALVALGASKLGPTIELVANNLEKLVEFLTNLSDDSEEATQKVETLQASFGSLATIVSAAKGAFEVLSFVVRNSYDLLQGFNNFVITPLTEGVKFLASVLEVDLSNSVATLTGVLLGGGALIAGLKLLPKIIKSSVSSFFSFGEAADEMADVADGLLDTVTEVVEGIGNVFKQLLDSLAGIVDGASNLLNSLIELATSGLKTLLKGVGQAVTAFGQSLTGLVNPVVIAGLGIFTATAIGLGAALRLAAPAIESFASALGPVLEILAGGIADGIRALGQAFVTLAENAGGIIDSLFSGLVGLAENSQGLLTVGGALLAIAPGLAAITATSIISGLADFVGLGFASQLEGIASLASPLNLVGVAIQRVAEGFKTLANLDIEEVSESLSTIIDEISGNEFAVQAIAEVGAVREVQAQVERSENITRTAAQTTVQQQQAAAPNVEIPDDLSNQETNELLRNLIQQNSQIIQTLVQNGQITLDGTKVSRQLRSSNEGNQFKSNI